jgi:Rrf2 family transcriptional regulator, nitric oxide-sensitive transcriptional repressor
MHTFISREQDYALRIAARLAELKKGEQISIRGLSEDMFISKIFAARIVHKLKLAGFLGTTQGKSGGVFLIHNPKKLSAYDILNVIGFKVKYNNCLYCDFTCELKGSCRFHGFFAQQETALMEQLKKMKISDFLFNKTNNKNGGF